MRSSRGFASAAPDYGLRPRPFKTRFRYGFMTKSLSLARDGKSPDHYAKGTPSGFTRAEPQTARRQIPNLKQQISNKLQITKSKRWQRCVLGHWNLFVICDLSFGISEPTPVGGSTLAKRPLIACRHVVSGSLSSPYRGSSHLSLALLGSLSVAREYLALRDGPRRFGLTFTCSVLLRCRLAHFLLPPTGLSPSVVTHSRAFG